MPILNNPASGSLSREENWVPTHSGEQEERPNGILIKYTTTTLGGNQWRATFVGLNIGAAQQGGLALSIFVKQVRSIADNHNSPN
jgi:hypothetical protein